MTELYKHDQILNLCKDKVALHIGACDSPYHIERAREGVLLHQKLQKVCKDLIGIDIDKKTIEELKNFGVNNIFYGDIVKNEYEIDLNKFHFDYILFSDVIEHLENPGLALDNIKELMKRNTKIILTAPNCFSYGAIRNILTKNEVVHPDHVFHTSYKTLTKLFERKNLKADYFTYCFYGSYKESRIINKLIYKLFKRKNHFLSCLFFVLSGI